MVKFADGGNKKRLQYNSLPWLAANDTDVCPPPAAAALIAITITVIL